MTAERIEMRSEQEVQAAETEFFERVWLQRHRLLIALHESGERDFGPMLERAQAKAAQIEEQLEDHGPYNDHEWGVVNGKLSALRWVLGEDWDCLDT